MGVFIRIAPPHRVTNKQLRMITDGMLMIIVVVWKKELMAVPIPVRYMWCAQTKKETNPSTKTEPTMYL
jgi:hypothetical protein